MLGILFLGGCQEEYWDNSKDPDITLQDKGMFWMNKYLACERGHIDSLALPPVAPLEMLTCSESGLTNIVLGNYPKLRWVACHRNPNFRASSVDQIAENMPDRSDQEFAGRLQVDQASEDVVRQCIDKKWTLEIYGTSPSPSGLRAGTLSELPREFWKMTPWEYVQSLRRE